MKYQRKPSEVEAFRLPSIHLSAVITTLPSWFTDELVTGRVEVVPDKNGNVEYALIKTEKDNKMRVDIGDYIIKDTEGDFSPCKADVFCKTYEPCKEG